MTADEILRELESLGNESYKRTMLRHGVPESSFGVKIEDLQKIRKRVKVDHELALALFDTGVYDAMYLAGLIADDAKMTKAHLRRWLRGASCAMIAEYTVPWVAAGSRHGQALALEWIDSSKELTAAAGWSTLGSLVSVKDDADLDLELLQRLLDRVVETIHEQPNRVRYSMNGFVIAVGAYVASLTKAAKDAAKRIGKVEVDMGKTACKVPDAAEYILKIEKRGAIGKKRKTAKC